MARVISHSRTCFDSIHLVAFDLDARVFGGVRDAGRLLLTAGDAKELNDTLDGLLRGWILVEQ